MKGETIMTKKEVKNENINNEVKEEEIVDVEEETLDEEVEVKESKLKKGINWIKSHKTEIALGAVAVVGGMIGYALGNAKEDNTIAIESGEDYLKVTEKSEEPVTDVELTSEKQVSEE